MCKKNKWILRFFTVLAVVIFTLGALSLTAYADDGGVNVAPDGGDLNDSGNQNGENSGNDATPQDGDSSSVEGGNADNADNADNGAGTNDDNNNNNDSADNDSGSNENNDGNNTDGEGSQNDSSSITAEDIRDKYEELRDKYINGNEDLPDDIAQYVPDEYLDELPTTAAGEVVAASAEPLPDVDVSDATLFSGIIMWVCVAVGISVVVGVMVSKRTHRRGV